MSLLQQVFQQLALCRSTVGLCVPGAVSSRCSASPPLPETASPATGPEFKERRPSKRGPLLNNEAGDPGSAECCRERRSLIRRLMSVSCAFALCFNKSPQQGPLASSTHIRVHAERARHGLERIETQKERRVTDSSSTLTSRVLWENEQTSQCSHKRMSTSLVCDRGHESDITLLTSQSETFLFARAS